ncbi:hypothetical protein FH608_038395 [Nonomuraea phyllanthi]|uniref:Uncharacterized protein n=1 Tax=Nonomuraea phyllanthi TaxID=2219224 RepID=A0A5C4VQQ9_9ACTN|nr:hypothetical protein [Nonomuraea phyllanthi]KAB8189866.1 hypothetical protein FH608_038395 [Nonomuraea phyllanthi]
MSEHVIDVPSSHLYPGLVLDAPAGAADFLVLFGDDSESRAQLLRDDTGRPVLRMGGYMTAQGTVVDERVWTLRETLQHGDRVRLRLGPSLP